MSPFALGEIIAGKYRIERVLGEGGMGIVVAAIHEQLGMRVALKFLTAGGLAHPEALERFLREARAVVQFHGEHVARVSDVGTLESGAPYIVMEYLTGADLGQISHSELLPVPVVVDYVLQACEAIAEAHALGIVHRDLKPSNLFLTERVDGTPLVKVLDFGISKVTADVRSGLSGDITATSVAMGTPFYMSPEQITSARSVDHRTDIWSLGVILHELLASSPPFVDESAPAVMVRIAASPPERVRARRPEVPPGLESVILRCLEKDRNARYADVGELAAALAPFAPEGGAASAERIARVLGSRASGHRTGGSARAPAAGELETAAAWGATGLRQRLLRKPRWLFGGLLLLLALLAVARSFRGIGTPDAAPLSSVAAVETSVRAASPDRALSSPAPPVVRGAQETPPPEISPLASPPLATQAQSAHRAPKPDPRPLDARRERAREAREAPEATPKNTPTLTPAPTPAPRRKDLFDEPD